MTSFKCGEGQLLPRHYLDHVPVLLFELVVNPAVLHDGDEGQGAFKATAPALHGPPSQLGQQLFSKPGDFRVNNAI